MAWNVKPLKGQYRYYDGLVHYLSMLHLCGSFKIWKPEPIVDSLTGTTTKGVTDKNADNAWYALDGTKQHCKPSKKGVYVKNGKKLIVQ